jgi:ABC-type uncharacterized transport system ATPase subunit
MASIEFRGVTKKFNDFTAVSDLDLSVGDGVVVEEYVDTDAGHGIPPERVTDCH